MMQHRAFPRIHDLPISALGFGCMRLPVLGGDAARIDEPAATRLLQRAIDEGVNYVDTAYPYHAGESERFLSRALAGGWRARVQLATKSPVWRVETAGDWDRFLDEQLARLGTERIDFYLLHALDAERWETVLRLEGLGALERARAAGKIGHLGFSFHGPLDAFKRIADGYDWEFCQLQLNYMDTGYQAGLAGLHHAAARGIGVIAMEPLRGGGLAQVPPEVEALWARGPQRRSPADWALRWVLDLPEVVTVLSGMNAEEQLTENLRVAGEARPGALGAEERARYDEVRRWFESRSRVPCTTCGYCEPCPQGVAIPSVLSIYNSSAMYSFERAASWYQTMLVRNGTAGDRCIACKECEPKCPQGIPIPGMLAEAHAHLTAK